MPEKTCSTCQCNKVCDHNKYGFENCGNYISDDVVPRAEIASGGTSCHWCEDKIKADTVTKMQEKFTMHFGTYTDKDEVKISEVFRLISKFAKQLLEENDG